MPANKVKKTTVLHATTGSEFIYTLPPEKAVVCAYEQFERGNYNTATYNFKNARKSLSGKTISCGNCIAIMNKK